MSKNLSNSTTSTTAPVICYPYMETPLILFDGYCNLCSRAVKFIIARDRKGIFRFTALQSQKGLLLLRQFNLPADQVESVVLIQGDKLYTKSTAALRILKELHGWPKLVAVFIILPRPLRDFVYDVIAKTRYWIFGKRDTCMVATKEISDRFL